jgi:GTPase SAR1 family protein
MLQSNINNKGYQDFQTKITILTRLIEQHLKVVKDIKNATQENNLICLKEIVQSTNFKVMVLGEFKRGKSTFINSLLGDDILPSYSWPCTAIINEVKYGDEKKAVLYYRQYDDRSVSKPPKEIPVDEIEDYVVIKDDDHTQKNKESLYEKLELFWPLQLCKNNVEIIDSPGLNEDRARQQVTETYLTKVDAILLVLACDQLFSESEQNIVKSKLIPLGHTDIFFICNRINLIAKKEVELVKQRATNRLFSFDGLSSRRIFFINALGALESKVENNIEGIEQSGISQLELELQKFLTNERGRVKILRPSQELKNSLREARKDVGNQRNMLNTNTEELEKRYKSAQEPLENLQNKRKNIVQNLSNKIKDTEQILSAKTKSFCQELVPKLEKLSLEYKLENGIKLLFTDPRPSIEAAIKEISSFLEGEIEKEFLAWQKTELEPLMSVKMQQIKESLDFDAAEFIQRIDNLSLEISGLDISSLSISKEDVGVRDISAVERVLSAGGALLMGGVAGIGSATIGATFGYQEMLKSLIPQILIGVAGLIFLGLNPITLIPMLIAGVVQGKFMEGGLEKKIKEEVGKKFSEKFKESRSDIIDKVVNGVGVELEKVKDAVNKGLGVEIDNVSQQVNNVLAEKQKGKVEVDKRLKLLVTLEEDINEIDRQLDDLITHVATS